ncbi:uncharacterized protein LOC129953925 [Eupeodes corollae]|uniref:uncharacterized protein LOC129953925 n=1 Tax=Eupeodes corollae TaxID=290404 RepID=UPI0024924A38|nr:uncharacterized protein LOC129953925 [Eupeodes corollae]
MDKTLFSTLFLYYLIHFTHGKRGFDIYLNEVNCTSNPKFVHTSVCFIDKAQYKQGRLFLDFLIIDDIPKFSISLEIFIIRSANEKFSLINLKNYDGCAFLGEKSETNLVNIYKEILAKAGELPICPLSKDLKLSFKNLGIDADKFPPYLPDANFSAVAEFKVNNEFCYLVQLDGSVVQKRKFG